MKKSTTTAKKSQKARTERVRIRKMGAKQKLTIGMDLGDRNSHYCVLDENGEVSSRGQLPTTKAGMTKYFEKLPASLVVMEAGTHSVWVSRSVGGWGHEVIVANPRRVKLITQSQRKNDRADAETLARLGRADRRLLSPIRHRGEEAQRDLTVIRARAELVEVRTSLINCARGLVKPLGERLKKCDASRVEQSLADGLTAGVKEVVQPLLKCIEAVNQQVEAYEENIDKMAKRYPEIQLLKPVYGVGTLIALTFILTLEDGQRFKRSRDVGPYLGLVPGQRDSGQSQPQMRITKTGDRLLRTLLVQGAHCILRQGAPESDLRNWGLAKQQSGDGKGGEKKVGRDRKGKRRAVVGVARRLAVLLHHLWVTGEVYEPLYNRNQAALAKKAA